ncbi:MAG: response regulator, partial [bacterium]
LLIPENLPDEVPQILEKISQGEHVNHYETIRVSKDGKKLHISLTISPIRDSQSIIIGVSTIARDITERKKAEEELKTSREELRTLSARLQSLQENERAYVSHEIQGQFGQALTALKMDLAWLAKKLPSNQEILQKKVEDMNKIVDNTFKTIQKVSTELRPKFLDDLGLIAAIEWEITELQKRTGIKCKLTLPEDELVLDISRSINVFRILQESLSKFICFTKDLKVSIIWDSKLELLCLEIIDNNNQIKKHLEILPLDLLEAKERTLSLGGKLQSILREGRNVITISIPFPSPSVNSTNETPCNPKPITKILIADSHAIVREGLKQILAEIPDFVVGGEASNALEMLEQIRTSAWHIVVMDISLPDKNGLDLLKQIRIEYPNLPVLVLSTLAEEQYILRVLKAGASGCLNKESAPDQLIEAVRKVARGGQYVSESVAEKIIFDFRVDTEKPLHKKLSDREFQIFFLIASGKTLTEIAQELNLSIKTISTYRSKLLQKMKMRNNVELVRYAIENNLIPK